MTPYSNYYFFYIIALLLIPAVIMGLCEFKIKYYGLFISIVVLYWIFGSSISQEKYLIMFFLVQFIIIGAYIELRQKHSNVFLLWFTIIVSISPLICTKFSKQLGLKEVGFLGISYLTFKAVQVLIEIYIGTIKEINFWDFIYFLSFFPTISSGPIDRSKRFNLDINKTLGRKEYVELLGDGLWKIVQGIGYKFVLAYLINNYWIKKILLTHHTLANTLKYMYSYSFYLFFDFAGYSLIAIGVSYILGVKTPDNFNKPFISNDIKDFWNRWHMSLSFWFRDYIYTRFVMCLLRKKWIKNKNVISYIGYIITMTTMGLWHGTGNYYIVYGLYHGILIVFTDIIQKQKFYKRVKHNFLWKTASTAITFNLICFGFLIFSGYFKF